MVLIRHQTLLPGRLPLAFSRFLIHVQFSWFLRRSREFLSRVGWADTIPRQLQKEDKNASKNVTFQRDFTGRAPNVQDFKLSTVKLIHMYLSN